ncbi:MAG: phage head-tail connector protein [Bacteroides sp.]|nr:phage head-tail connector protein [Eubacterium sp.]MCM1419614.1 phage head-tail connector protein [Roseburia sp.]MCM1463577.1 phage head-tail connector protein [Bacteroides sp.]
MELTALERLKLRLGEDAKNTHTAALEALLQSAEETILDLIGRDVLPPRLISVQVELALILFNRQGAEGETSRSEGGIARAFLDGLPDEMKERLKSYPRKVRVIKSEDHDA